MLVLALDTATPTLVAGVARRAPGGDVQVLAERAVPSGNRHAELLAPAIEEALAGAGCTLADLDVVVTGLGPGPFTGLRVGVVTAASLADALGLPVVGVCSLDAIGAGERTVVTDARRKELYWANYDAAGVRRGGPAVDRPDDVRAAGTLVGDHEVGTQRLGMPVAAAAVTTAGLVRAAAADLAAPFSAGPLEPLYLRRPDAVPPTTIKAVSQK